MPPENAYTKVEYLVKKFKSLSFSARSSYNEDNTRKDFILPLFHALDWNIYNSAEVCAEERVSRGWVDFSFRIDDVPRFFLETKKIAEDLTKPSFMRQAIDYAWTKSVTWALLSDFEGLKVFNAEWQEDNPLRALFLDFNIDTYLSDFDRLRWLSRPEVAAKTLDRQAEKVGMKARRQPVSMHLFDDLKYWRHELFRHLHVYNPMWSYANIDEAVLRILNRLIFIRTAEDRQVEELCLQPLLRELRTQNLIQKLPDELKKLFSQFNESYNSQLFEPSLADALDCEPRPFEVAIEGMYGKNYMLYNFNAIDADVLGTAYEQYLGHVIADPEAAAEVVEKRTKRKSQGIYYTPTFIVKYIVQQTLGRYLEEFGFNPSNPPRVLDMACGSGSFLIEAFDVLDRYVAKLRKQDSYSHQAWDCSALGVSLHDHARHMEILTQCIYGVDKDEQAVAVARLNLMLKTLHSRDRLPILDHILSGDSLISGTPEELQAAFGLNWQEKKPFNWKEEFLEVWKEGGFDVIIGNPPYVRQETLGEAFKVYAQGKFETYAGTADLYIYFIEQAHRLLKPDGYFGMICSNKFLRSSYGKPLREFLSKKATVLEIIDFAGLPVFADATVRPIILVTSPRPQQEITYRYLAPPSLEDFESIRSGVVLSRFVNENAVKLPLSGLSPNSWSFTTIKYQRLIEKFKQSSSTLNAHINGRPYRGIITGHNEAFVINQTTRDYLVSRNITNAEIVKPVLVGRNVRRYHLEYDYKYLIWTYIGVPIDRYPAIFDYLKKFQTKLQDRWDQGHHWWELRACDYYSKFNEPKIIFPDISTSCRFVLDTDGYFGTNTTYFIPGEDLYLLGLLNSKIAKFYFSSVCAGLEGGGTIYLRFFGQYIEKFPVRSIDSTKPIECTNHDRIVALVQETLQLHKDRADSEVSFDNDLKRALERRIAAIDAEIDHLVYHLYGLTEEEIKVVEGPT
jgi:type I restriction-modification system DNA methylase subunit